jgi:putative membrane protein
MLGLLATWLTLTLGLWITAQVLPGFRMKNQRSAWIVAAIFGILNALLSTLLFVVFSIATLGIAWLLGFLTNWLIAAILLVATDKLTDHLKIDGFGKALIAALLVTTIAFVARWLLAVVLHI